MNLSKSSSNSLTGFTLAELLIALAILGVIATFTIPKILNNADTSGWNAKSKEVANMIISSRDKLLIDGQFSVDTAGGDMTPYMKHIKVDTTSSIDGVQTAGSVACNATRYCLELHNGGKLMVWHNLKFNGSHSSNAIQFFFDPDGKYSGTTTGPGKSVAFVLYYDGLLRTFGTQEPNTCIDSCSGPTPAYDPPWFSWNN